MANVRFIGNAQDIANKWTVTIGGTWANGDKARITINEKDLEVTIGATVTLSHIVNALAAAFNGADLVGDETRNTTGTVIPEMAELTAGNQASTTFTLTGNTAGVPHTITVSKTSASGTISIAQTTNASGKSWWDNVDNWDTGAIPANGDDVFYDNTDIPILYGLGQAAVTINSLTISNLQAGAAIGLPKKNDAGYTEYRPTELAIGCTTLRIDDTASSRIKINLGSVANTTEILSTGFGESGLGAVLIRGTSIGTLEVQAGSVDVARFGGEAATITTLRNSGATLHLGAGVGAITTLIQAAGSTTLRSNVTTMTVTGGVVTINGAATVGTLTVSAAIVNYRSSGTATTVTVGRDGVIDASSDVTARTFTTTTLNAGGRIDDPHRTITFTNKVAWGSDVQSLVAA